MRSLILFGSLLLIWQIMVMLTHLPNYLLPSPLAVLMVLKSQSALILAQTWPTVVETLIGLGGAILLGMIFALLMAYLQLLRAWLKPLLLVSQALPTFAIAPLIVLWLGYGISSKIVIIWLMLFFPVSSAFFDGLQQTPNRFLDYAQIMQTKRWRTLWYIRVPTALPSLATGIRVACAGAPLGAVIGEWVGASHGLGFLILNANARLQIALMFAGLLILVLWSLTLYFTVDRLLQRWQSAIK